MKLEDLHTTKLKLSEIRIDSRGSRSDFIDTWLVEMPSGSGNFETFDALIYGIKDLIKHGFKPVKISENLFRLINGQVFYY